MARFIVGAVAGAVYTYYTGDYQGGLAIFSAVYGVSGGLDPNSKVSGPRLDDLKAPAASYGATIPWVEGHPRLGGVIVWSSNKQEIASTASTGKGGPGVDSTTYTYKMDVLIVFNEGPFAGIRRAWSNGKLCWTQADDSDAESLAASQLGQTWDEIRINTGAPDQLPDPTYEAAFGVGNVPAMRDRGSATIVGLNLGGTGQPPLLTFEVMTSSDDSIKASTIATFDLAGQGARGVPAFSNAGFTHFAANTSYSTMTVNFYEVDASGNVALTNTRLLNFSNLAASGNSDVSGMLVVNYQTPQVWLPPLIEVWWFTGIDSGAALLMLDEDLGSAQIIFSKLGDDLCLASNLFGAKKVRRYSAKYGGAPLATSVPLEYFSSLAIGGDKLYCLSIDGTEVTQLDLETLAVDSTFPTRSARSPSVPSRYSALMTDEAGVLYVADNFDRVIARWDGGSNWHDDLVGVPAAVMGQSQSSSYGYREGTFFSLSDTQDSAAGEIGDKWWARRAQTSTSQFGEPLSDVVARQCQRGGLQASDYDTSALAGQTVEAMAVSQISTPRSVIEMLMSAYYFDVVGTAKLVFVPRGSASVLTIPFDDLGAASGDDTTPDQLPLTKSNDTEIPQQVTVKYSNVDDDYQDGSESSDRLLIGGAGVEVLELALGLTPTDAKRIANVRVTDYAASMVRVGPVSLNRAYAALEPTDAVDVVDEDGSVLRVRIQQLKEASGLITIQGVVDNISALSSVAQTSGGYNSSTTLKAPANTVALLLDIPILRDADDAPGFYVAAKGSNTNWFGYSFLSSLDDVNFNKLYDATGVAVIGICTTVLPAFNGGCVFDEVSTLTVSIGGGTLSSYSRDDILNGTASGYLVGDELLYARSATMLNAGVYALSGMLRGRRGTEWAMPEHGTSERFVVMQTTGMRRVTDQLSDVGIPKHWKAVSTTKNVSDVASVAFTDTAIGLKPFSPVDLRASRDSGSGITLTWKRRTRFATRFVGASGISVPLGESSESYTISICADSTYTPVLRTLTSNQPSVSYPAASQQLDFGDLITTVFAVIRQVSAEFGEGEPLKASTYVPLIASALPVPLPPDAVTLRVFAWFDPATGLSTPAFSTPDYSQDSQFSGSKIGIMQAHPVPQLYIFSLAAISFYTSGLYSNPRYFSDVAASTPDIHEVFPAITPGTNPDGGIAFPTFGSAIKFDSTILVIAKQSGTYKEIAFNADGSIASSTDAVIEDSALFSAATPSIMFNFAGKLRALGKSLAVTLWKRDGTTGQWQGRNDWTIYNQNAYITVAPFIAGVDYLSGGGLLVVAMLRITNSGTPQTWTLVVLTSTDGETFTECFSTLLNSSLSPVSGIAQVYGLAGRTSNTTFSPTGLIHIGNALGLYVKDQTGIYVWISNNDATVWTKRVVSIDGVQLTGFQLTGTIQDRSFDGVVGNDNGTCQIAQSVRNPSSLQPFATLVRSTDGFNFTTVSDVSLAGYTPTASDILLPLMSAGQRILVERIAAATQPQATLTQTAALASAGVRRVMHDDFLYSGSSWNSPLGDGFALRISGPGVSRIYTAMSLDTSFAMRHAAFLALESAVATSGDDVTYGFQVTYDSTGLDLLIFTAPLANTTSWFAACAYYKSSGSDGNISGYGTLVTNGMDAIPSDRPQIVTVTFYGMPVVGCVYRITLDGVNFDYTAVGGETMAVVATQLASDVDADASYISTSSGNVVTITYASNNVEFTYSAEVISS